MATEEAEEAASGGALGSLLDSLLGEAGAATPFLLEGLGLGILALVAAAADWVARRLFLAAIHRLARASGTHWDDALVQRRVFGRLAHLVPVLVVHYGVTLVPALHETLLLLIQRTAVAVGIVMVALAASGALDALNDLYSRNPENRRRPIKGYVQVGQIVFFLVAGLLVLATLMDRSPWLFLSGLGALAAVLLLVFRDTILGLVASLQLTGNDMIHVGDWIEMPQYGADGDVIDVALHTVKVQNWDKTITTIPTHKLISESFRNWRGMAESGGRRIKRSVRIDLASVRFLSDEEVDRAREIGVLAEYIDAKRREIDSHNADAPGDPGLSANRRRLTNLGTLRAYLLRYLREHPELRQDMTLLVRQLPADEHGVPLEIYCFTDTTEWGRYEDIQGDLFDHLFAVLPEFGLRAFQGPSGTDLRALARESS